MQLKLQEPQIKEENFIEMSVKDIRVLKEKIWLMNDKKCPVLDKEIPLNKMALDHNHKRNDEEYSEHKGTIRTSLDFRCNAVLGKLENSIKRTGLNNEEGFNIAEFLRNAADYFEKGAYRDEDNNLYIHPKEVKRSPKLSKKNYNKLAKLYKASAAKAKFPEFPSSGKLTKPLEKLFNEFQISPFN